MINAIKATGVYLPRASSSRPFHEHSQNPRVKAAPCYEIEVDIASTPSGFPAIFLVTVHRWPRPRPPVIPIIRMDGDRAEAGAPKKPEADCNDGDDDDGKSRGESGIGLRDFSGLFTTRTS